ncbi:hypothetical protein [Frigoribacterium sp. CFBP9030]|uniref:hypothetical protein n=1 Tax=Frigoribacterium sp. CFBP9030 TaxID=3096537 RepID=UPI002A6AB2E3|nr:hypothetical protein [Frigoribacterium sp. CFBP9030]MDY0893060.1 hypothetical protein [Frigoribacterium sp. CFBP9030]
MTFFPAVVPSDDDEVPSESYRAPEWAAPPTGWLPSRIGVSALLASTDDVAITIRGLAVYPTGVALDVDWSLRSRGQTPREWADLSDRFEGGRWRPGRADPARGIRFGVALADGTKALTEVGHGHHHFGDDAVVPDPPLLTLNEHGGTGDDELFTTSASLWLWPLPSAGALDLVVSWPEFDVAEARHTLDAVDFAIEAARARPLWPTLTD